MKLRMLGREKIKAGAAGVNCMQPYISLLKSAILQLFQHYGIPSWPSKQLFSKPICKSRIWIAIIIKAIR